MSRSYKHAAYWDLRLCRSFPFPKTMSDRPVWVVKLNDPSVWITRTLRIALLPIRSCRRLVWSVMRFCSCMGLQLAASSWKLQPRRPFPFLDTTDGSIPIMLMVPTKKEMMAPAEIQILSHPNLRQTPPLCLEVLHFIHCSIGKFNVAGASRMVALLLQ